MSYTLTALRQQVLRELDLGWVIPNGSFDAAAVGSITSANILRNSNWGGGHFKGLTTTIYRPGSATAADNIRYAGLLTNTSGLLAHTGANYADTTTTSEVVELWKWGVRPDLEVLDAINRALADDYVTTWIALSDGTRHDFSMEETGRTEYTDVGTPTVAKDATVSGIPLYGKQSLTVLSSGASEGVTSQVMRVNPGRTCHMYAMASVINTGGASLQAWDADNSVTVGDAVTHTDFNSMLMVIRNVPIPATCHQMSLRMLGTTTTSYIAWQKIWLYKDDELTIRLGTYITESFMAPKIFQAVPTVSRGTGIYDARSIELRPLVEGIDYRLIINHYDGEPYKAIFRDASYYQWPLFVEARRPASAYGAISAEADLIYAPAKTVVPRVKKELLETVYNTGSRRHPDWERQYNFAVEQLTKAAHARPIVSAAPDKPSWNPRLSAS